MTLDRLIKALAAASKLSADGGLERFSKVLAAAKDGSISATVNRVKKCWIYLDRAPADSPALSNPLKVIAKVFDEAGAKQQAKDLKKLLELFSGSKEQSIDDFIKDLAIALGFEVPSGT